MSVKEMEDTAANLDAMASEAATVYYDTAVKYGIAKYPKSGFRKTRNWKRFIQIARLCLLHNVPVDKFVTTAFTVTMDRHPMVTVNDIAGFDPKRLLKGDDGLSGTISPQDLWNMLTCKLLDMVFQIDGVKDKTDILDSTMYGFPAWFRVFSPHDPVNKVIVHWGDLAYEELSENPKLDAYVKEKRPVTYDLLKSVIAKI